MRAWYDHDGVREAVVIVEWVFAPVGGVCAIVRNIETSKFMLAPMSRLTYDKVNNA